ncbi:MAG: GTPase Era [Bacteroidales bacterium]|nr:GTPase Era [Bacteroidales bacterium]
MPHKAGFVNIIGYPNVGKSTLMNALVGEKLSIITSKAQTTRHRIMGIVSGEEYQIIFSDTPGIVRDPAYKMHEMMNKYIDSAIQDADIFLLMTEPGLNFSEDTVLNKVTKANVPLLLLINKIDLSNQEVITKLMEQWHEKLPSAEIIPISAQNEFNIEAVMQRIMELLPENPAYFEKDELTNRTERFFVSEIIREKILLNYKKEIPYSVEVMIDSFKELENIINIQSTIFVEREPQKGIILGHQGKAIKKTGTMAREDMEVFFGKKVFLQITVKVKKDWRNNEITLSRFGYDH